MILLPFLGVALAFALLWPSIAKEKVLQKCERLEEEAPFVHICHCKECGYNGRISLARNGNYNRILRQIVWECPQCGKIMWNDSVECVLREYEEEIRHCR